MDPKVAWLIELLVQASHRLVGSVDHAAGGLRAATKYLLRTPVRVVGTFIFAPFVLLYICQRCLRDGTVPRVKAAIALAGLLLGFGASYLVASFLGSTAAFFTLYSHAGIWWAMAFLIGTTTTVYVTVALQVLALTAVSALFVKFTDQDFLVHLERLARGGDEGERLEHLVDVELVDIGKNARAVIHALVAMRADLSQSKAQELVNRLPVVVVGACQRLVGEGHVKSLGEAGADARLVGAQVRGP